MTSSYCLHHQCNNVAFATIVFLLTTMIDMREQTMLTEHPTTTEYVPYSKQITSNSKLSTPSVPSSSEKILLNVTTTDTVTSSEQNEDRSSTSTAQQQQHEAAALLQSTPTTALPISTAELPKATATVAQTMDQYKTSYSIKFTTFRPLLVPTLPDIRHRIIHSMPYQSKHHHERHWGPFFEEPLNVTSGALQVGYHLSTEAILNCRVGMLKDKTVMWIRRTTDKVSLLTVGNNTYSGDPRIRVKFQYPNNWRLHINPIKNDDGGLYMCQVSTHPPRVFATNLTVLEPAVRVVDEMGYEFYDRYYKLGSTIDISCQVSLSYLATLPSKAAPVLANSLQLNPTMETRTANSKLSNEGATTSNNNKDKTRQSLPQNVVWKKDGAALPKDIKLSSSFSSSHLLTCQLGGTSSTSDIVCTPAQDWNHSEGHNSVSLSKQWFNSRLSIIQAERAHSGLYTCTVADKQTTSAQIQVLNGETPAAVQHNGADKERAISALIFYCVLCWIQLHISYT